MTAEAVAGAVADWLDRDDVAENRAADEVRARAAEVADAVLAALPRTGDATAVHVVAHEHGRELVCSCGTLLSNYGITRTLHSIWAAHLREVRAALTAGAGHV